MHNNTYVFSEYNQLLMLLSVGIKIKYKKTYVVMYYNNVIGIIRLIIHVYNNCEHKT